MKGRGIAKEHQCEGGDCLIVLHWLRKATGVNGNSDPGNGDDDVDDLGDDKKDDKQKDKKGDDSAEGELMTLMDLDLKHGEMEVGAQAGKEEKCGIPTDSDIEKMRSEEDH
uniref:Uncharacterized protein n=1 Tax=Oryza rufipogon TaxID=4529 RepID=A0A0E0QPN0_ORYRU